MPTGGVSSLLRVGRVAVIALAFLLLAGCGGNQAAQEQQPGQSAPGLLKPPTLPVAPHLSFVHVIVYDGDLSKPVPGAVVQVGSSTGRTGRDGVARIKIGRHARLLVTVARSGYDPYRQRLQFRGKPKVGVRVYQTKLQWLLYGASAGTHADASVHPRAPAVPRRLEPGGRRADRVPGRVDDDVAFVSNYHGSVRALLDARRRDDLAPRHRRQDGRLARRSRATSSSSTGWTAASTCSTATTAASLWTYDTGAPIESSPLVRRRGRLLRHLERDGLRARPAHAPGALDLPLREQDHLERGLRERDALHRRLRRAAARAGRRATARLRWSARVGGRIYGTPAVASGRVFVTSSTGGSLTAFSTGGSRLWSLGTGSYVYSSPAVWNGHVYFGSYNGTFYAVGARTGARLWRFTTAGAIAGAAVDRRRGRLLQQPPAPDLRPERAHRAAGLPLPRRRLRAGLRQRAPAAPARVLAPLRGRAQGAMRKALTRDRGGGAARRGGADRVRALPQAAEPRRAGLVDRGVRHHPAGAGRRRLRAERSAGRCTASTPQRQGDAPGCS